MAHVLYFAFYARKLIEDGRLAERIWLSVALARLGRSREASREIRQLLEIDPESPESLFYAAVVRELVGERAKAFELLQSALQKGFSLFEVEQTHWLADLRSDEPYREMLAQLRLDPNEDPGVTTTLGSVPDCPSWTVAGRGFRSN